MESKYLLGIDIGTHVSKGVLIDLNGKVIATSSIKHELLVPEPGLAEHKKNIWWDEFCFLSKDLINKSNIDSKNIEGIGCSAITPALLPLDKYDNPLRNAILYGIDTRASKEVKEMTENIGEEELLENNGIVLSSQSVGPKILWLMKNEPEIFKRTSKLVSATTYLVYKLTSRSVIDYYSTTCFNPIFDINNLSWSNKLWKEAPIDMLPDISWTTDIAGFVTKEASKQTGLKKGTPVIVGTADASAEGISAGVVEIGDLMIMLGTSSFFIQIVKERANSKVLWPANYLEPNQYAIAAGMGTAGAVINWFYKMLGNKSLSELDNLAERVKAGSEGLILLPYFSGERTPINNPNARGLLFGLSLYHKKDHVFRAIMEGIAYGIKDNLEHMEKLGTPVKKIVTVGGGTNSEIFLKIINSVLDEEILIPEIKLGASYGDAFLAGKGVGIFNSIADILKWIRYNKIDYYNESESKIYKKYYNVYKKLYMANKDLFEELTKIKN